jgi:hypothetical protein
VRHPRARAAGFRGRVSDITLTLVSQSRQTRDFSNYPACLVMCPVALAKSATSVLNIPQRVHVDR